MGAWQLALLRTQGRVDTRRQHPASALAPVVQRYLCFSGTTTSGIEQTFTQQCQNFYSQRDHCSVELEVDE
eukprot:4211486-Pyramimonas_sp.AAC.1